MPPCVVIHVHTCDSACGAVGDEKKCAKLLPYGRRGAHRVDEGEEPREYGIGWVEARV